MGQAALHVTTAPCRLKHLSPMLRKTGYLLFLFLRSSDLSHLRASHSNRPHSGSHEPMFGFVQMPNLLPHFLHCSNPT